MGRRCFQQWGVSDSNIFWEDGKRGGELQMLRLVLPSWGLICVRLKSDWALTDGDYTRSAPRLSCCHLLYRLISLDLTPQHIENGLCSDASYMTDTGWDEAEIKRPQIAEAKRETFFLLLPKCFKKKAEKKAFLFLWALKWFLQFLIRALQKNVRIIKAVP